MVPPPYGRMGVESQISALIHPRLRPERCGLSREWMRFLIPTKEGTDGKHDERDVPGRR
jgi:hypothetical protein